MKAQKAQCKDYLLKRSNEKNFSYTTTIGLWLLLMSIIDSMNILLPIAVKQWKVCYYNYHIITIFIDTTMIIKSDQNVSRKYFARNCGVWL